MEPTADLAVSVETASWIGMSFVVFYMVIELALIHFRKHSLRKGESRMAGFGLLSQALSMATVAAIWGPLSIGTAALIGATFSPVESSIAWPWWIVGFVAYEFFYWLGHWGGHKVRLLWCVHSPHHAPADINMLIGTNHSFLESSFYFPFCFGFLPALFGVHPVILFAVSIVDNVYGSFLHLSHTLVTKGRYGFLGRFMQTPSHHRVHHAQNVGYMDTNYNSITLFWDWIMGTLEPLRDEEPVLYGITRDVDTNSFWDVHFGEFVLLWRDMRASSSLGEALGYCLHAPGWSPNDASKTVSALKARLLSEKLGQDAA